MTWNIGGDLGTGYIPPLSPSIGADVWEQAVIYDSLVAAGSGSDLLEDRIELASRPSESGAGSETLSEIVVAVATESGVGDDDAETLLSAQTIVAQGGYGYDRVSSVARDVADSEGSAEDGTSDFVFTAEAVAEDGEGEADLADQIWRLNRPNESGVGDDDADDVFSTIRSVVEYGFGADAVSQQFKATVVPFGLDGTEFGLHEVSYRPDITVLATGLSASLFGTSAATLFIQRAQPVNLDLSLHGLQTVRLGRRFVSFLGRSYTEYGTIRVKRENIIDAFGIDGTLFSFGRHLVYDNGTYVKPRFEFSNNEHGLPLVFNLRTIRRIEGWRSDEIGDAQALNQNQFVNLINLGRDESSVSNFSEVRNINREVRPDNIFSESIGIATRADLGPPGLHWSIDFSEFGAQFVAHAIRSVLAFGRDMQVIWTPVVYSPDIGVTPSGQDASSVGSVGVERGEKYVRPFGGNYFLSGNAWVSDGVRVAEPRGIDSLRIDGLWVSASPRSVVARSIEGQVGWQFAWVAPLQWVSVRSLDLLQAGFASVENKNKTLGAFGLGSDFKFGVPFVGNFTREVRPPGVNSAWSYSHIVSFAERTIFATGLSGLIGSVEVSVFPRTPDNKFVYTAGFDSLEADAEGEDGGHFISEYKIFCAGFVATEFGDTRSREMAILLRSVVDGDVVTDAMVLGHQTVEVGSVFEDIPQRHVRVSPHTIWATTDTPAQAVANHPNQIYRLVDEGDAPFIPEPVVSNFVRSLLLQPFDSSFIGDHAAFSSGTSFVYQEGTRGRVGILEAIGGDLTIECVDEFDEDTERWRNESLEMGRPSASFIGAFNRTVTTGNSPIVEAIGSIRASRNPEELNLLGYDSLTFGTSSWPSGAGVHLPYPPFPVPSVDPFEAGIPVVGRSPTEIEVGAGEQLDMRVTEFDRRMRFVYRMFVQAGSSSHQEFGLSWISYRDRPIFLGAPMPFRPTAPLVCFSANPSGVDAQAFGDETAADFVESGKAKRVGVGNQFVGGVMRVDIIVSPSAGDLFDAGALIAYNAVNAVGIEDSSVGLSTVLSDGGHVCGQLPRAVLASGVDSGAFGLQEVGNA